MSLNKGQNEQVVPGIQWRIYVCCSPSWSTYFLQKAVFVATAFIYVVSRKRNFEIEDRAV